MRSKRMLMTAALLHAAILGMAGCGGSSSLSSADSGAGSRPTNTDSGASEGGVPAECKRPLSESGCPATYADARASIQCSLTVSTQVRLAPCGKLRLFLTNEVDVGTICAYDTKGTLLGSRECSKPIGNCNCFYAGETIPASCDDATETDPCASDAGP